MKAVVDSSVLIDANIAGLFPVLIALPVTWIVPDLVFHEICSFNPQVAVNRYGLRIVSLSGEQVAEIPLLAAKYPGPGIIDLAALCLAKHLPSALATNDKHLRNAAVKEGLAVIGTLWVLDETVSREVLTPGEAVHCLDCLLSSGSRFPARECDVLRRKWQANT